MLEAKLSVLGMIKGASPPTASARGQTDGPPSFVELRSGRLVVEPGLVLNLWATQQQHSLPQQCRWNGHQAKPNSTQSCRKLMRLKLTSLVSRSRSGRGFLWKGVTPSAWSGARGGTIFRVEILDRSWSMSSTLCGQLCVVSTLWCREWWASHDLYSLHMGKYGGHVGCY